MPNTNGLYTALCIRTYSGEYIDVVQIKPEQIFIEDIAISLSRICRFGNYTKRFYSVAEHSIWCYNKGVELYPDDTALHLRLLLHDAHEAYLGDWVTPMVDAIDNLYPKFKEAVEVVKRLVQGAINTRFGIKCPLDDQRVKEIDRMALEEEWETKVLSFTGITGINDKGIADIFITYFKKLVRVPAYIPA